MSDERQYGMHEIPGTEAPAPSAAKTSVSAGFELQTRGYINQLWAKLVELEGRIDDFEASSSRPFLSPDGGAARGEGTAPPSSPPKRVRSKKGPT